MRVRLALPWLMAAAASVAVAAQTMGPNACVTCHDHQPERAWAAEKDGPPPKGHVAALAQLESAKAKRWLRTLAIAQPYAPAAGCVRCHATLVNGDAIAGVTCESCHGPGKGYAVVHQDKGAYRASVAAGMYDTRGRPEAWVTMCVSCHVVDDRRLVRAGHPGGDTFDAVKQVRPVVHWKRTEPDAVVAAAARTAVAAAIARRTAPAAAVVAPPPASTPAAASTMTAAVPANVASAFLDAADLRLLTTLEGLLRRGAYAPRPITAVPPAAFSGSEADWLRLQQEVVNLAIEALRKPPAPGKGS